MLTVKQVAELLQVNPETVKRMIYRGEIQAVKVGSRWRISEKEVAKFRGGK